jgi:pilus assembly protein CpaF
MAINTGHNGSMWMVHANSALDALHRMENLALTGGVNLVLEAIRGQITQVLDVVINLAREEDGRRHVAEVAVVRQGANAAILMSPICYRNTDLLPR